MAITFSLSRERRAELDFDAARLCENLTIYRLGKGVSKDRLPQYLSITKLHSGVRKCSEILEEKAIVENGIGPYRELHNFKELICDLAYEKWIDIDSGGQGCRLSDKGHAIYELIEPFLNYLPIHRLGRIIENGKGNTQSITAND